MFRRLTAYYQVLAAAFCLCILALPVQAGTGATLPLQAVLQAAADEQAQTNPLPAGYTALITPSVSRFYQQRQWSPVWTDTRLEQLLEEIRQLDRDGLNPDDYFLPELETYRHLDHSPAATAMQRRTERELLATRACLLALRHLYRGKTSPAQLDPQWNFTPPPIDSDAGLKELDALLENNALPAAFNKARPAAPAYNLMRLALAEMRIMAALGGSGPLLKPGMTDERVPLLRRRLEIAGLYEPPATTSGSPEAAMLYDERLADAVRRFQKASHIEADGKLGADTLQQLNIPTEERIGQLRVNLERMRWHLHELHDNYVMVDIAGYRIAYVRNGEKLWQSRVQVGRTMRKTPVFQSEITYLTFNPRWKIPPTIYRKDALPAIRKDIGYLARHHLQVYDAAGRLLDPAQVNWNDPGNISLVQQARPDGALGQLAIRFPNDYSVYLHETPNVKLFDKEQRAFSSGCIRVENVRELGVLLLDDPEQWSREALEAVLADGKTRDVSLKKKVPVLLAYWTVDIENDGTIAFRPDIYGYDPLVLQALDGNTQQQHTTGTTE